MMFQDQEAVGTVEIFPCNGIKITLGGDEENTLWLVVEREASGCFQWKQSQIQRLAIGDHIIGRPFIVGQDKRTQVKGVRSLTITGDTYLCLCLMVEEKFHRATSILS